VKNLAARTSAKYSILTEASAGEPAVALDRAGITVFRNIAFLAAGPASERNRSDGAQHDVLVGRSVAGSANGRSFMINSCRSCGQPGGQALAQDWEAACSHCGQLLWLRPGDVAECKVTRLTPFGIFVELGDGVEGIIHISELASHAVGHPEDVVAVGTLIRAQVLRIDVVERKIGLSCRRLAPRDKRGHPE
jgi:hypothetical protein